MRDRGSEGRKGTRDAVGMRGTRATEKMGARGIGGAASMRGPACGNRIQG